jgi:hypothetical protein
MAVGRVPLASPKTVLAATGQVIESHPSHERTVLKHGQRPAGRYFRPGRTSLLDAASAQKGS